MRLPTRRHPDRIPEDWKGPRIIPVLSASGGAGTSTLCALLARTIALRVGPHETPVVVIDDARHLQSPWTRWPVMAGAGCGKRRGLDGVAVVISAPFGAERGVIDADTPTTPFPVAVADIGRASTNELRAFLDAEDAAVLLAIDGTVDGATAAVAALNEWAALGLLISVIRPVVLEPAGGLSAAAKARLALVEGRTQPVHLVPRDRAISARGLAEALMADAVRASTLLSVDRLVQSIEGPAASVADKPSEALVVASEAPPVAEPAMHLLATTASRRGSL